MILLTRAKNHFSFLNSDNGISSFYHSYSNNGNRLDDEQHLTESSYSLTDPTYLQSQGSNLYTIIETEAEVSLKPPFIKRILLVDDDPDIILTFKAGLVNLLMNLFYWFFSLDLLSSDSLIRNTKI